MKKHLLALASCALLLLAAGCNNENKEPTSLNANEARPTWAAPEEYDYTSSMTAVISVNRQRSTLLQLQTLQSMLTIC